MHGERGVDENLNAPGMQFVPLSDVTEPMDGGCNMPDCSKAPGVAPENRFYMYGVVARLALLAASLELEMTDPQHPNTDSAQPAAVSAS